MNCKSLTTSYANPSINVWDDSAVFSFRESFLDQGHESHFIFDTVDTIQMCSRVVITETEN